MIHFRVLCFGYLLWNSNRAVFYTGDCTNERNRPHTELNSPLEYLILSESRLELLLVVTVKLSLI